MTTDWRLYGLLVGPDKSNWRPGDEPPIKKKIVVQYGDRVVTIPLPEDALVEVED